MKKYQRLGVTDERDGCECCGRYGLKKVVALKDSESGDVVYFGSSCAARAEGWGTKASDGPKMLTKLKQSAEALKDEFYNRLRNHPKTIEHDQSVQMQNQICGVFKLPPDQREIKLSEWGKLKELAYNDVKKDFMIDYNLTSDELRRFYNIR